MDKLNQLLLQHNFKPGNLGFTYIKWILENNDLLSNHKMMDLYMETGRHFNHSMANAERVIRYAIEHSDLNRCTVKDALTILCMEYSTLSDTEIVSTFSLPSIYSNIENKLDEILNILKGDKNE